MQTPYHWIERTAFSYLLWPASRIYWGIAWLRTKRVKPQRVSVPVICVGNNVVGGAGKTPTVIALCHMLQQEGKKVHVISRGYKGQYQGTVKVDASLHIAQEVGDEPLLISRHAPCWVARKRIHAARAAIADGAEIIIMDDGLQNPSLHKDLTMMVVDGSFGFGNGLMLPAGPCREPVSRSIQKADTILIIGDEKNAAIRKVISADKLVIKGHLKSAPQIDIKQLRVHPFAGIGMPEKFFKTVADMGAEIVMTSRFDDHHYYTAKDIERLRTESRLHQAQLVTTEKDFMRLPEDFKPDVMTIPVSLEIAQQGAVLERIRMLYA